MSNKHWQKVFNKMYTNESTNRERIRFRSTRVSDSIKLSAAYWNRLYNYFKRTFNVFQNCPLLFRHRPRRHGKYTFLSRGLLIFHDCRISFCNGLTMVPSGSNTKKSISVPFIVFGYHVHYPFYNVRVYSYRTVVTGSRYFSFLTSFFSFGSSFFTPACKRHR